jgi:hypothetical protein
MRRGIPVALLALVCVSVGLFLLVRHNPGRFAPFLKKLGFHLAGPSGPLYVKPFAPDPNSCVVVQGGNEGPTPCMRALFGVEGSSNITDAANKLKACLKQTPQAPALLIGFGDPGQIDVGDHEPPSPNQLVTFWNDGSWSSEFQDAFDGAHSPNLTLLGCWTGAQSEGVQLLEKMRVATQTIVRAQNSVVFCRTDLDPKPKVYLDEQAEWVEAGPTKQSTPQPISQRAKGLSDGTICLRERPGEPPQCVKIDPNSAPGQGIKVLRFMDFTFSALDGAPGDRNFIQLQQTLTKELMNQIDFSRPFEPGIPYLRTTGSFDLLVKNEPRHFVVYGDAILQDKDHPEVLYWVNKPGFRQLRAEAESYSDQKLRQH